MGSNTGIRYFNDFEEYLTILETGFNKGRRVFLLEFDVDLLTFSFQVFIYLHVTLVTLSGCSLHPLSLYVVFGFFLFIFILTGT